MNRLGPLFADVDDVVRILIIVFFIVIPAVSALIGKLKEAQKEAAKRARGGGAPGGPKPRAPQAGARRPDAVRDEVAEFLRRAQGRGGAREAGPPRAPRQPAQPLPQAPPPARPQPPPRPPKPAFRPLAPRVEEPLEVVEVVEEQELGTGVSRHVQQYLGGKEIDKHARRLGEEVVESDERLEEHLHKAFDHDLGRLGHLPGEAPQAESDQSAPAGPELPATAAAGFAALMSEATSAGQAIIFNEILRRPEDRWA